MQIILSPAKTMNLDKPIDENWRPRREAKDIIVSLLVLPKGELLNVLKVEGDLAEENIGYVEGFKKKTSYSAVNLYNGLAYRSLDFHGLDPESQAYLNRHLKILSALYGPISPLERIKPYRLDLTMDLMVKGQSIKKHWEDYYKKAFSKGETIFNLASKEFSCLLNKEDYHWVDFEFQEEDQGKIKKHASISKKGRGKMARYMAMNKINDIEDIKAFDLDGYRYIEEESREDYLVFRRPRKK